MNKDLKLTPLTGTFVSPLLGDTGINNYGLEEWETDFRLMRAIGIDTVIVIRCEMECGGRRFSALDPRSVTWPEDPDLLSMFFRLSDFNFRQDFLSAFARLFGFSAILWH